MYDKSILGYRRSMSWIPTSNTYTDLFVCLTGSSITCSSSPIKHDSLLFAKCNNDPNLALYILYCSWDLGVWGSTCIQRQTLELLYRVHCNFARQWRSYQSCCLLDHWLLAAIQISKDVFVRGRTINHYTWMHKCKQTSNTIQILTKFSSLVFRSRYAIRSWESGGVASAFWQQHKTRKLRKSPKFEKHSFALASTKWF